MMYIAVDGGGQKYECEGDYVSAAVRNLALRHPELIGRWVEIGGVRDRVPDPNCVESI